MMTDTATQKSDRPRLAAGLALAGCGFAGGMLTLGIGMWLAAPTMMLSVKEEAR